MKSRLLIAGTFAGIVAFLWGAFTHTVLGIESSSLKVIPNEPAVLSAMSGNVTESGLYFFPGSGLNAERVPAEQRDAATRKWEDEYKALPHGFLIVTQPTGASVPFVRLLSTELASNILGGLLAAFLLSLAAPSLSSLIGKVIFVALLGVFAVVSSDVSYWNWYEFPTGVLASSVIDLAIGWALAGLALGLLIKPKGHSRTPPM